MKEEYKSKEKSGKKLCDGGISCNVAHVLKLSQQTLAEMLLMMYMY